MVVAKCSAVAASKLLVASSKIKILGCLISARAMAMRCFYPPERPTPRSPISVCLANANAVRDWRIYADFAQSLIGIARPLYVEEPFGVDLSDTVYALDATTIDLCLSVFPWTPFRSTKAAIKLHTLLDLRGTPSNSPINTMRTPA